VRILFMMVYVAGDLTSLQSGFAFARFMDPFTMGQASPLDQFMNLLAIMVFFAVDGHHILIRGLTASFKELPIGTATIKAPLIQYLISSTGRIFAVGLKIGAPVIVTLFLCEIGFGMLSRMIPQVNVFVEGLPLKIFATIMVLSFSLGIIVPIIGRLFKDMDTGFLKIFRLMV